MKKNLLVFNRNIIVNRRWEKNQVFRFTIPEIDRLYKHNNKKIKFSIEQYAKDFFSQGWMRDDLGSTTSGQGFLVFSHLLTDPETQELHSVTHLIPGWNEGDLIPRTTREGKDFVHNNVTCGVRGSTLGSSTGRMHLEGKAQIRSKAETGSPESTIEPFDQSVMAAGLMRGDRLVLLSQFRNVSLSSNTAVFQLNPAMLLAYCDNDLDHIDNSIHRWNCMIPWEVFAQFSDSLLEDLPALPDQKREIYRNRSISMFVKEQKAWETMPELERINLLEERLLYFAKKERSFNNFFSCPTLIEICKEQDIRINVDAEDKQGRTALSYLAENKNSNALDLMDRGADIFKIDTSGKRPWDYILETKDIVWIAHALAQELKYHGDSRLNLERIDYNMRNSDGMTLLHEACYQGNTQLIKFLLDKSVDIDSKNLKGNTSLTFSIYRKFESNTALLLNAGADPTVVNVEGLIPFDYALETKSMSVITSIINYSFKNNNTEAAKFLLEKFINQMFTDARANNFYLAFQSNFSEMGIDINGLYNNQSLLHIAVINNNLEAVNFLLRSGANPNILSSATPLHIAVALDNKSIITALLEAGGNPYIQNLGKKTVFDVSKDERVLELLSNSMFSRKNTSKDSDGPSTYISSSFSH